MTTHPEKDHPMTDPQHPGREEDFAPCPTCHQYSHTLGDDQLTEAFMHFQSMFSHRGDGIPTQHTFDDRTRDAAQVLMAAARSAQAEREAVIEHLLHQANTNCGENDG